MNQGVLIISWTVQLCALNGTSISHHGGSNHDGEYTCNIFLWEPRVVIGATGGCHNDNRRSSIMTKSTSCRLSLSSVRPHQSIIRTDCEQYDAMFFRKLKNKLSHASDTYKCQWVQVWSIVPGLRRWIDTYPVPHHYPNRCECVMWGNKLHLSLNQVVKLFVQEKHLRMSFARSGLFCFSSNVLKFIITVTS